MVEVPPALRTFDADAAARRLGEVLRGVRQQQGLSLADVEQRSDGLFRASVIGAYERGERAISVVRLERLAAFYRVPVTELLASADPREEDREPQVDLPLVIDLVVLSRLHDSEPAIARFARYLQLLRHDYNGRVLTVRRGDLQLVAIIDGQDPRVMQERLSELGIIR